MSGARAPSSLSLRSPPMSPEPHTNQQLPASPEQVLRTTRSVDSFSRPGVNSRVHRHTQSANPPPRTSSRPALLPAIDDIPEELHTGQVQGELASRSNRQSGIWDSHAPLSPGSAYGRLPPMAEESDYFAHALTTPDNSAVTPPFTPGLGNVAEEPERFASPRPAPHPPMKSPKPPRSPTFDSFSFSSQRSPIARRRGSYTSPKSSNQKTPMTRPISQMSDTLGSLGNNRRGSVRRTASTRRKSNTWRVIEGSWEDDIDFIYDNALEADCDFDWDCTSDDDTFEDRDRTPEQQDHDRSTGTTSGSAPPAPNRSFPGSFRASLLVPSASSVPELEIKSAVSTSTIDTPGLRTPSDFFTPLVPRPAPLEHDEQFGLNPVLLVPQDLKEHVPHEEMYDDLLADYDDSDRHFPLLEASQSVASSTRSSHVRSSKRSSYDSSLMSSGQTSGSWSAGVRRSASSSGSLPELVHSRRTRQDLNSTVEHLTEQVASFPAFVEETAPESEDDDTTPPGNGLQQRTFFATDNEPPTDAIRASIEGEVKTSLELARRGSVRSSRAPPLHKYASSDGAAKLLASPLPPTPASPPTKVGRSRAASSSSAMRKSRGPYLSLFPTPPTRSPLATPSIPGTPASHQF